MSECSLCLSPFDNPVSIPCGHVYCSDCLAGQVDASANQDTFPCPICRVEFNTAAPNLTLIPQKYHQYILPVTRRVYIENENANEATDELKSQLAQAEEHAEALQRDLQRLRTTHVELRTGYQNLLAGHQNLQTNYAAICASHQGLQGRYQHSALQIEALNRRVAVRDKEAVGLMKLHAEEVQTLVDAHDDTTRRLQWSEEQTQIYKDKYADLSAQLAQEEPRTVSSGKRKAEDNLEAPSIVKQRPKYNIARHRTSTSTMLEIPRKVARHSASTSTMLQPSHKIARHSASTSTMPEPSHKIAKHSASTSTIPEPPHKIARHSASISTMPETLLESMRRRNRQLLFSDDSPERDVKPKIKHELDLDFFGLRANPFNVSNAYLQRHQRDLGLGEASTRRHVLPTRPVLRLARRSVSIKVEG